MFVHNFGDKFVDNFLIEVCSAHLAEVWTQTQLTKTQTRLIWLTQIQNRLTISLTRLTWTQTAWQTQTRGKKSSGLSAWLRE